MSNKSYRVTLTLFSIPLGAAPSYYSPNRTYTSMDSKSRTHFCTRTRTAKWNLDKMLYSQFLHLVLDSWISCISVTFICKWQLFLSFCWQFLKLFHKKNPKSMEHLISRAQCCNNISIPNWSTCGKLSIIFTFTSNPAPFFFILF